MFVYLSVSVCVLCVYVVVCLSVCRYALQNQKILKRNYGKIISNVSANRSPIRVCPQPSLPAGTVARVSGWGRTSDGKTFLLFYILI